ncbi:MAG TPA: peptide chain release factor N(5)-glutamine methyltransferase [Bacteroidetes bacterium]|nr:peptide chain release factor N(5)-glutamine methyltransferase [Bacteroidota bacterium]
MSAKTDWTVLRMLEWATEYFNEKKILSPRLSIEWLLSHVLNVKRLDLYMQFDRPLTSHELDELRALVKRRALHEPLQYITGSTSFYNAEIFVDKNVLIPRSETEELVELILNDHSTSNSISVLDIGTGSGCIPIAIQLEMPEWALTGIDISEEALTVARKNNSTNKTSVKFLNGDLFNSKSLPDQIYDVIVSNPPYIPHYEKSDMDKQVIDFEPHLALFCDDRDNVYQCLVKYAQGHLKTGGILYVELHHDHPPDNENLFDSKLWSYQIMKDLGHNTRFLKATLLG